MRNWITLLMTILVGCGSYANANVGQVSFEAGYRRDTIDWKQRFPSNDPFVSTKHRFKDLDIFQLGVHGRSVIGCNFYVRGSAYWGWILDGDYKRGLSTYFSPEDSYAFDDNFKFGFSDERNSVVDDQYVFGISGGIGYPFYFCNCSMILAPVIGYSFDEQNVRVNDPGFNFGNGGCDDGCGNFIGRGKNGNCCRQTFISRWYGPFVGVDFDWQPCESCFNVWAELEYHWGNFRGKRSEADDLFFEKNNRSSHHATAWVFGAGFDYDLCNQWTVGVSVKVQDWRSSRHHKFRGSFGDSYDESNDWGSNDRIRDNHKWRSYAINLTFGRDF